jgi:hypothetical protein
MKAASICSRPSEKCAQTLEVERYDRSLQEGLRRFDSFLGRHRKVKRPHLGNMRGTEIEQCRADGVTPCDFGDPSYQTVSPEK